MKCISASRQLQLRRQLRFAVCVQVWIGKWCDAMRLPINIHNLIYIQWICCISLMRYTCINCYLIDIEYESSYIACIDCVSLIHGGTYHTTNDAHFTFTWVHSPWPSHMNIDEGGQTLSTSAESCQPLAARCSVIITHHSQWSFRSYFNSVIWNLQISTFLHNSAPNH